MTTPTRSAARASDIDNWSCAKVYVATLFAGNFGVTPLHSVHPHAVCLAKSDSALGAYWALHDHNVSWPSFRGYYVDPYAPANADGIKALYLPYTVGSAHG